MTSELLDAEFPADRLFQQPQRISLNAVLNCLEKERFTELFTVMYKDVVLFLQVLDKKVLCFILKTIDLFQYNVYFKSLSPASLTGGLHYLTHGS